jgi:hypothetical protein
LLRSPIGFGRIKSIGLKDGNLHPVDFTEKNDFPIIPPFLNIGGGLGAEKAHFRKSTFFIRL